MRTPPLCEVQGVYIWNESNETETRKLLGDEKNRCFTAKLHSCSSCECHHGGYLVLALRYLPRVPQEQVVPPTRTKYETRAP
jgi:hypothetical protein